MKFLTCLQLEKILRKHKYMLLRDAYGRLTGVNCKAVDFAKKVSFKPNLNTNYIGYRPCNFMEYITYKTGFINNN